MKSNLLHTFAALLIAAFNVWNLLDAVMHYTAHADSGMFVPFLADCGVRLCLIAITLCVWKKKWYPIFVYTIAAAVCTCVVYYAAKIPFCPECDHVTSEELGWMNRWIKSD